MKRGLFSVPPNLIIHAIVTIAALALMVLLITTFLKNPDNSSVENELENFVNFINAFEDSDRTSDTFFVANTGGAAMYIMFTDGDRYLIKHALQGSNYANPDIHLKRSCKNCVCAYVNDFAGDYNQIACEDVSARIIQTKDESSHFTFGLAGMGAFSPGKKDHSLDKTGFQLLATGIEFEKGGATNKEGFVVEISKNGDDILLKYK